METAFLYLLSKKIPKPLVARIIALTDIQKYYDIGYRKNIVWLKNFTANHGADTLTLTDELELMLAIITLSEHKKSGLSF